MVLVKHPGGIGYTHRSQNKGSLFDEFFGSGELTRVTKDHNKRKERCSIHDDTDLHPNYWRNEE